MASRLFPRDEGASVAGVYAFCRFTDDLVDEPHDGAPPEEILDRLDAWRTLAHRGYVGEITGVPLVDTVMGEARRCGVSWLYPEALLDGVAMDLAGRRYADWDALEQYTFGVAGAVGGWMSQLFGIRDRDTLERAHALGHGMQLTNIVRDVGEDWRRGRVYLPDTVLHDHGLTLEDVGALMQRDGPLPGPYIDVVEATIARADAYYEHAWPAIRTLPGFFRRPVAAAAEAYRGIHQAVRRNRYDNLNRRAHTSRLARIALAIRGLIRAGT
jgi:phytoene synthase